LYMYIYGCVCLRVFSEYVVMCVCAGFGIENGECLGDVIEKEMSDQVGRP